jgi:hypothetical protein
MFGEVQATASKFVIPDKVRAAGRRSGTQSHGAPCAPHWVPALRCAAAGMTSTPGLTPGQDGEGKSGRILR